MAKRRDWDSLSENYRKRLERKGISRDLYQAGVSLKVARGHEATPEHPRQAFRNPDTFGKYLRRRRERGEFIPAGTLPPVGEAQRSIITTQIGWPGRFTHDVVMFTRSKDGATSHARGTITKMTFHPDGTVDEGFAVPYDQADFVSLAREARARGFTVQVVSIPALGITA